MEKTCVIQKNDHGTASEVLLERALKEGTNVVANIFIKNEGKIEFLKGLGFKPFGTRFLADRKGKPKLGYFLPSAGPESHRHTSRVVSNLIGTLRKEKNSDAFLYSEKVRSH